MELGNKQAYQASHLTKTDIKPKIVGDTEEKLIDEDWKKDSSSLENKTITND